MTENGYVKLSRAILTASWYTSGRKVVRQNIKAVYLHCLLRANWTEGIFQRIPIRPGEYATSLNTLSIEIGLSIQQVRTALATLEATGYITSRSAGSFRIISISNYDCVSESNKRTDKKPDDKTTIDLQKSNTNKKKKNKDTINTARGGITRDKDLDSWLKQQTREKLL